MRKLLCMLVALILATGSLYAQTKTISGKIVDKNGKPVEGAAIRIKGKKTGVSADEAGNFSLSVHPGEVLIIAAINFKDKEVLINGSTGDLNISLDNSDTGIDEVVITASGAKSQKKTLGYNATSLSGTTLTRAKPVNVASGLSGQVAGLEVSASGGGVNPNYRLVLRGQRSLLGNNQALVVVDNVIVPSSVLGNLNPEDIEDITVLNGSGAVALYGSDASNGALVVTTKKGKPGQSIIKVANINTFEHVAFLPKHQTKFGQGGTGYGVDGNGIPIYSPRENQSYGPAFDGSLRNLGDYLEDGSVFQTTYSAKDDWKKFWQTGYTNQTDLSLVKGDDKSTFFLAGQFVTTTGTVPKDRYNRASIRISGTREISNTVSAIYSLSYVQNRYNTVASANFSTIYDNLNNIAANVPITQFKDWRNNKFANPNGYFNPWYANPYFNIDSWRTNTRNDYLIGSLDLRYAPLPWLDFVWRSGLTTQNQSSKSFQDKFTYTTYALYTNAAISGTKSNIPGYNDDNSSYNTQITSDFFVNLHKNVNDFSFSGFVATGLRHNVSKNLDASVGSLAIPGLFNLSNTVNNPLASSNGYTSRRQAIYGEVKVGYKDFLYLHATGRNDWVSVLAPNNRSFFYPAVDFSFVASNAIEALRASKWLDYLKVRGGISRVGNVNIGPYSLQTTYGQANGYPYNGVAGFTAGNTLVDSIIKPEFTKSIEFGVDFSLFHGLIDASATYYTTNTTNQTVTIRVPWSTGYSGLTINTGETKNNGLETRLAITPVKNHDWTFTLGGNYTYSNNKVVSLNANLPSLALSTYASGVGSYAVPGMVFPVIMGNDYKRDPEGHVIVDAKTGRPALDNNLKVLGNAATKDRIGLDVNLRYKQFRLYSLFEYRGGNKIYNSIGTSLDWSGVGYRTAVYDRKPFVFPNSVYIDPSSGQYVKNTSVVVDNANDGFWADNDGTYNRGINSNYVTSGAFWKWRQLSITYDVPASVLRKTKAIKGATIGIQGRNLFLWLPKSNLYTDPEYSDGGSDTNGIGLTGMSSAPPSRYYGFSVTLTF